MNDEIYELEQEEAIAQQETEQTLLTQGKTINLKQDKKKGNTNMKIIDETTNKDEEPESYGAGDVIACWDDENDKHLLMLAFINGAEDKCYEAINLNSDFGNDAGSDDVNELMNYGYNSYTDIIDELKAKFDHVEKVKTELHIVGRA